MNKFEKEFYAFSMAMLMSSDYNMFSGLSFEEMIIAMDHKIMSITLGITFEIRELIEKGYSYEDVKNAIKGVKEDEIC